MQQVDLSHYRKSKHISTILIPLIKQLDEDTCLFSGPKEIDNHPIRNAIVWLMNSHKQEVLVELFALIIFYPQVIFSILNTLPKTKLKLAKEYYGNIPQVVLAWLKWAEENGYLNRQSQLAKVLLENGITQFKKVKDDLEHHLKAFEAEKVQTIAIAHPVETVHALIGFLQPDRDGHIKTAQWSAENQKPISKFVNDLLMEITGTEHTQNGQAFKSIDTRKIAEPWKMWLLSATTKFPGPLKHVQLLVATNP